MDGSTGAGRPAQGLRIATGWVLAFLLGFLPGCSSGGATQATESERNRIARIDEVEREIAYLTGLLWDKERDSRSATDAQKKKDLEQEVAKLQQKLQALRAELERLYGRKPPERIPGAPLGARDLYPINPGTSAPPAGGPACPPGGRP